MVGDGVALALSEVLDDGFLDWLAANGIRVIDVSYRETMHDMACNGLALGRDRIVSPRHCARCECRASGGGASRCSIRPVAVFRRRRQRPLHDHAAEAGSVSETAINPKTRRRT